MPNSESRLRYYLAVILFASAVYLGCMISPPSLMDDVDAVQAQIARNMLTSGDWVTARLDGVVYLEKAPLIYWLMAVCYKIFGVHDWAARIPVALSAMACAWLTAAFGMWAFGRRAGFYAGLCISTCVGLFLFTRILIPDVMLTATMALSMWAFLRAIDDEEPQPATVGVHAGRQPGRRPAAEEPHRRGVSAGGGRDLSGPHAATFAADCGGDCIRGADCWSSLLIAAPWHVLATLRNPPYFDFTLHSAAGRISRFLVVLLHERAGAAVSEPALSARLQHRSARCTSGCSICSGCFPGASIFRRSRSCLSSRWIAPGGRACWRCAGPASCWSSSPFPPRRNIIRCRAIRRSRCCSVRPWRRAATGCAGERACWPRFSPGCAMAAAALWFLVRGLPAPGDISSALSRNPGAYTLSLGHMEDLTLNSFAYLRSPLLAGGGRVSDRRDRDAAGRGTAGISGGGCDDGAVFPCRAHGDGGVRSVPVVAARWPRRYCARPKAS